MSKIFAAVIAAMFTLGTVSVFAADDMKKDSAKKDAPKAEAKKDEAKKADKK